jgi:hypothetical protein
MPPMILRRQTEAKGKGSAGRGGAAKGAPPKGSSPKGSSGSASSSGGALEHLLASPASQEAIGKAIDGALDQLISWLRGTTDTLIPPELMGELAKGIPAGALTGMAPPKASGSSGVAPLSK